MGGAGRLLSSRTEPDFVKSIGLGKGVFFQSVVTGEDRILAPVRSPFFFGGTREWIVIEGFSIGLESANRSVSSVCQNDLCPGQRDTFGFRANPQVTIPLSPFVTLRWWEPARTSVIMRYRFTAFSKA
jgi:hypothetical protein